MYNNSDELVLKLNAVESTCAVEFYTVVDTSRSPAHNIPCLLHWVRDRYHQLLHHCHAGGGSNKQPTRANYWRLLQKSRSLRQIYLPAQKEMFAEVVQTIVQHATEKMRAQPTEIELTPPPPSYAFQDDWLPIKLSRSSLWEVFRSHNMITAPKQLKGMAVLQKFMSVKVLRRCSMHARRICRTNFRASQQAYYWEYYNCTCQCWTYHTPRHCINWT